MGERVIVIHFGDVLTLDINKAVQNLTHTIRMANIQGIIEIIPCMTSIAIKYDPIYVSFSFLKEKIEILKDHQNGHQKPTGKTIHIPVVFNKKYGFDLEDIARTVGRSIDEIIHLISNKTYYTYMIGFIHGLPYMGDIDKRIQLPRKSSPILRVPKGSIAIANEMIDIYTIESPGGWHIVGWTPMEVVDVKKDPPNLIEAGDYVKFEVITEEEAENWDAESQKEWDQKWNT